MNKLSSMKAGQKVKFFDFGSCVDPFGLLFGALAATGVVVGVPGAISDTFENLSLIHI